MTHHYCQVSAAEMFLGLLFITNFILTSANPFHKYPYVFLLDVGNEELEKTNTEQIRLSIPGGSLAVRYPAVGNGDTIGHIRVSGVDFGTDLKSSIIEGGPGYNYVVLVFVGNKGVPYDAVVTITTVPDLNSYYLKNKPIENVKTDGNYYQVEETPTEISKNENNAAEDLTDDFNTSETQYHAKTNAEVVQMSSNVYNYADNEVEEENDGDADQGDIKDIDKHYIKGPNLYSQVKTDDSTKDIHKQYIEDPKIYSEDRKSKVTPVKYYVDELEETGESIEQVNVQNQDNQSSQNDATDDQSGEDEENNTKGTKQGYKQSKSSKSERYTMDYYDNEELDNQNEAVRFVDRNLYEKYKTMQSHLPDMKVYPQNVEASSQTVEDVHDPIELDQMFNDEEIHNDEQRYIDNNNNNNNFDTDDSNAVAS